MSLSRAQKLFIPANINSIVLLNFERLKNKKINTNKKRTYVRNDNEMKRKIPKIFLKIYIASPYNAFFKKTSNFIFRKQKEI